MRVVVAVVLSVISLTVLSLHVALCLHYPSPLFAVTLLLNPSLFSRLTRGKGVGRARQRKEVGDGVNPLWYTQIDILKKFVQVGMDIILWFVPYQLSWYKKCKEKKNRKESC